MEVDWPGRPSTRSEVGRLHGPSYNYRPQWHPWFSTWTKGARAWWPAFSRAEKPFIYIYIPRISVCAQCTAIKSRIGTTPRQGNANSFCNEEFGSGVRAPHSITVRCYHWICGDSICQPFHHIRIPDSSVPVFLSPRVYLVKFFLLMLLELKLVLRLFFYIEFYFKRYICYLRYFYFFLFFFKCYFSIMVKLLDCHPHCEKKLFLFFF